MEQLLEILQQIGAYAGFAAVVGLAVLAALYFSQARDLRALREEGRAPAPSRPIPAARPVPAPPPPPPGQAAQRLQEQRDAAGQVGTGAAPAGAPAATAVHRPPASQPAEAGAPRVAMPPTRTGVRLGPRTPLATPGPLASRRPWYRRLEPRYLALIVGGLLIVGGGAIFAVTSLFGGGEGEDVSGTAVDGQGTRVTSQEPLDPSTVTVSVLNGTQVPGLAAQIGDTVEAAGFQRGNITNAATPTQQNESVVLFAPGEEEAARAVGKELGISQRQPIDSQSRDLAGPNADVVVIAGTDQTL